MYRNKKDNSSLYILMIKLERELIKNKVELEKVIGGHTEYNSLKDKFIDAGENSIFKLYSQVNSLNSYVYENIIYEYGEVVAVEYEYSEKQYETMRYLENLKHNLDYESEEYQGQIDELNSDIERIENSSIFEELSEIDKNVEQLLISEHHFKEALNYLSEKVKAFNSMEHKEKLRKLNNFCKSLLDEENEFSKTVELFKKFESLGRKLAKPKSTKNSSNIVTIRFDLWDKLGADLLAVYDPDAYLELDQYYHKNEDLEIGIWDIEHIKQLHSEMNNILDIHIIKNKNKLKNTLSKTNWLFDKI